VASQRFGVATCDVLLDYKTGPIICGFATCFRSGADVFELSSNSVRYFFMMASKKSLPDDEQFNISFVQTVEKYQCLYDHTLKAYSNRAEQDKAWNQVAGIYFSTGKFI